MSEQLQVCKALAALIRKHGEPNEQEINFVAQAAMELSLTPEQNQEVQQVLKEGGDYAAMLEGVESKALRVYLFRRVVAATLIDEKVEDDERALIDLTATSFGFDPAVVKEFLGWMEEGIAWEKRGADIAARLG